MINLKKLLICLTIGLFGSLSSIQAQSVYLAYDKTSPQSTYAYSQLSQVLKQKGYQIQSAPGNYDFLISLATHPMRLKPESFSIIPEAKVISIYGGDQRGMIYGALAVVEALENGQTLGEIKASEASPNQEFRAIKFNLPWQTYRESSALDLHMETAKDPEFWKAFLDMMVKNRFNTISLWNMHPYTFMIKPKNFPEASPWTDQELAEWKKLYASIFQMAKERGLDTYLVHWSIFVSEEFSQAHGLAKDNVFPNYYVEGDTSEIVRRYLRESVTQVLEEYPDLDGIGISHGEGMAGMTPLERQLWMDDVLIAGMLEANRPVKLIHRVPFSSGLSSEGGTSRNVEVVTREAIERLENRFDGPIWAEMKFNWSHAHSTPKLVKVHGGDLGDTYFDPLPSNYKITWMARNEDFFALRWGVPSFIREHIARNGEASYVGGYFVGSECYIPAKDYFTSSNGSFNWKYAFERQWLFYKLWGRLLYDPKTPDKVFQAAFNQRYGDGGDNLLNAFSLASSTQLRLASQYDSKWDFTLYSEGFLALQGDTTKFISVNQLIAHPTMDKDYVSVADYVDKGLTKGSFGAGSTTPLSLAKNLEHDNLEALRLVEGIDVSNDASLLHEVADVKIWANLGLYFAEKLRGAVALQTFRKTSDANYQQEAIDHLEKALAYWDEVIQISRPLYKDMPLTHYNHNFFYPNEDNLFHWALLRKDVARDIEIARNSVGEHK
ncbi:hypothetical protein [Pararhodonellum marinum]|uniref:hypothetical protein n=1 Tax=Pararhodonellum marinum TaxID=2755358 RepID=UPI001E4E1EF5|nr:hypothetical protein [Pararhodonellum marinum]